jgi:triosephosphate isomerase
MSVLPAAHLALGQSIAGKKSKFPCYNFGMQRKKIIVGNWKMNPLSSSEAEKIFVNVAKKLPTLKNTEVVICPPFVFLDKLKKIRTTKIRLGAQNAFYGEKGAFTGEISAEMLELLGVKYVILGHSERRAMGESNQDINKKIKAALFAGLVPIVCVGESERDESHKFFNVVKMQIEECLAGIPKNLISKMIIAYEPVWAIGRNAVREATPEEFREMSIFTLKIISKKFGTKIKMPRIIYGGSVDEKNASGFIREGEADGFLAGRASLNGDIFTEIVKTCEAYEN